MKKMLCGGKSKMKSGGKVKTPCDSKMKMSKGGGIKQSDLKSMGRNMAKVKAKA